jgi:hypothetical protein
MGAFLAKTTICPSSPLPMSSLFAQPTLPAVSVNARSRSNMASISKSFGQWSIAERGKRFPMYVPNDTEEDDFSDTEPTDPPRSLGYCASCHDPIPALGAAVCGCCQRRGFCVVCGLLHGGARMCPAVAAVWAEQEAIEKAERSERVQEAAIHNTS